MDKCFEAYIVTKPLQYINVLNISSSEPKVLLLINSFYNSKSFFEIINKNSDYWDDTFFFNSVLDSLKWLIDNKKNLKTIYTDSDFNHIKQFYLLKNYNITVYEEGIGTYRKKLHMPRTFYGRFYQFLKVVLGFKNRRGGSRFTKNVIVYYPDFYVSYLHEKSKKVSKFKLPLIEHIAKLEINKIFQNIPNLNFCKNKNVVIFISSPNILKSELEFVFNQKSDVKLLKPHPHIKNNNKEYGKFDFIISNEIPSEILINQLIKIVKKITIISNFSSSTIYFLKHPKIGVINLPLFNISYNDSGSYMDTYKNLNKHIYNHY